MTALHCEAKPLIDRFELKKDPDSHKFDLFENDTMILIVSGIGKIRSAVASTYLLSKRNSTDVSVILNLGICGAFGKEHKIGELHYINKITDHAGGRQYFPDPILRLGLREASLETFDNPVEKTNGLRVESDLADMEASGFFQAASMFVETHQIYCLKIVSDFLELSNISKDFISSLIRDRMGDLERILTACKSFHTPDPDLLTNMDLELISKISVNLKLTRSQHHQLIERIRSAKVRKNYRPEKLSPFSSEEIKTKNDNKNAFNRIRQILDS